MLWVSLKPQLDKENLKQDSTTRSSKRKLAELEVISVHWVCLHQSLFTHHTDGITDTVAADPTGKGYASGGEDGYVRVHHFDKGYYDFNYEVERQAKAQQQAQAQL